LLWALYLASPLTAVPAFLDRLYAHTDYARRRSAPYTTEHYHLGNMRRLLSALGHPEKSFRILHLAGTKGKGSTSHFLSRIIREKVRRVGLYTSPQNVDERDRIQVNGKPVSWTIFRESFERIESVLEKKKITATVFEIFTAMAFCIFREQKAGWAVVEVGLGGRLDSTNVVNPEASVITPIHFDHMDKLGHTLAAIASEKAGIIKRGKPVFSAPQFPEARRVIVRKALEMKAPISFSRRKPGGAWEHADLPPFQRLNLSLALQTAANFGFVPEKKGFLDRILAPIPGRFQEAGPFIFDGAHNPFAIGHLVKAVESFDRQKGVSPKTVVLFFAMPDKPILKMEKLFPKSWTRVFYDLKLSYVSTTHLPALKGKFPDLPVLHSLEDFKKIFKPRTRYVVTGSFSLVSFFLKHLPEIRKWKR
ncbi:MAG: hypothetical protein JNM63_19265, partial [Spirochaetia bacterium]|nr:hypothetical protein [Spirochaetia bacterium]